MIDELGQEVWSREERAATECAVGVLPIDGLPLILPTNYFRPLRMASSRSGAVMS